MNTVKTIDFSQLSRAHSRGIKKCPKCNYYSAIRSHSCRNEHCDLFTPSQPKPSFDGCKLHTGSLSSFIYSVRLREKGPDYRGFVELTPIADEAKKDNNTVAMLGKCHIAMCTSSLSKSTSTYSNDARISCQHIKTAITSTKTGEILQMKKSVISLLNIAPEMKQSMYILSTSHNSVQRVSLHTFAVKVDPSKYPIGFLHIFFRNFDKLGPRYSCNCLASHSLPKSSTILSLLDIKKTECSLTGTLNASQRQAVAPKCIHFYLCVSAFASNPTLYKEFQYFVDLVLPKKRIDELDDNIMFVEGDETMLSIIDPSANLVELSEDITTTHELSEDVLSPFVSQMIELPDGNGHMIELHAELQTNECLSDDSYSDNTAYQPRDLIVSKNSSEVTKPCDVLLANSADNFISNSKQAKIDPLDLQVMLAESGSLISLPNVVFSNSTVTSSKNNTKTKNDVINLQQVSLQKANKLGDNIYAIAAEDNSLKIISLKEYDTLLDSDANLTNTSYQFMNSEDCLLNNNMSIVNDIIYEDGNFTYETIDNDNATEAVNVKDLFGFERKRKNKIKLKDAKSKPVLKRRKKKVDKDTAENSMLPTDFENCIKVFNNASNDVLKSLPEQNHFQINNKKTEYDSLTHNDSLLTNIITVGQNVDKLGITCENSVQTALNPIQESASTEVQMICEKSNKPNRKIIIDESCNSDKNENLSFLQWLSYVTESINQTMHYQCPGKPKPLVFHTPHAFFDCFQKRFCTNGNKMRLPNLTTAFERKTAVPLGKFIKHTWNITNIFHIKKIFDTPDVKLEITRYFQRNQDKSYTQLENPLNGLELKPPSVKPKVGKSKSVQLQAKQQPSIYLTYLMVGNTERNQKVPTPFCIEWIPDIVPKCKFGELRLKFKYGHKSNQNAKHKIITW